MLVARGASLLGASPQAGYVACGTATFNGPRGSESGAIEVEAWGASHCRVTVDLSRPGEPRRWVAVLDGRRSQVTGPQGVAQALAAPSPVHGCALLPQSAILAAASPEAAQAAEAPALSLDPATGLPASLAWQSPAGRVEVAYADYQSSGGVAFPAKVTESLAGRVRLAVQFTALTARSDFTEADFAVQGPPAPATHGDGGGQ
ncbi:MAG TPA: hypothetical protein VMV31_07915 [Terriglobales bacterium]|nr:hypothetical protein [Terriglobales bacterium]